MQTGFSLFAVNFEQRLIFDINQHLVLERMDEESVQQDHRIRLARELILRKKDLTLNQLFKVIPRKVIAESLGLNIHGYINVRSKEPENFKLRELIMFSEVFDLDLSIVVNLFVRSIE